MSATSLRQKRMEDSHLPDDRSGIRKQNYKSRDWCPAEENKAPSMDFHLESESAVTNQPSFGIQQEQNASVRFRDPTTVEQLAHF
jgi:hypothetical protein